MTPEQRRLTLDLAIYPPYGNSRISKEEFAARFPSALDNGKLASNLLNSACNDQNVEDLSCALLIGYTFGFTAEHEDWLCRLVSEDWHTSHEDVVSALVRIGATSERVVNALYEATQRVPPYLAFDDARALAVKAIWGIGKIPGSYSEAKLEVLAKSQHPILRQNAEKQRERRKSAT